MVTGPMPSMPKATRPKAKMEAKAGSTLAISALKPTVVM